MRAASIEYIDLYYWMGKRMKEIKSTCNTPWNFSSSHFSLFFLPLTSLLSRLNDLTSFRFFLATKQQTRKLLSINYTHDTLIAHRNRTKMAMVKKTETKERKSKKIQFVDIKPNQSILNRVNVCLLFDRIH